MQNGFHVPAFPVTRGKTQGGLVSLMLFKVVVHNVVITCLEMTVEDHRVSQDGLGETVGRCWVFFYDDDDMVSSRDSD